ncbi:uncharacterized protein LOC107653204 isoform X2 [Sinocyclocheilus anshuiensis]|uniref:uncharacterized protein LOC107653204 isoform X2 n=1 Tax=Sinocyclocheilus anshuiensis TaxID=1608454 RepID=UPI0007B8DF53|nr:PREDICTED: uncharacterized protein LOC107653204 isoform X2 [Sinocyclocheilus anshuiensis]
MSHFLLVICSLIIASAAEMSREFRRCSPRWVNASQVKASCSDIQIAQYCDPDQSCRNMSKPGVSLEKDRERGLCLTITNCSYESWSCEALSYIDGEEFGENFTVNLTCNQPTSTLPSPGLTSTSATSGSASTLPSPGNNESGSVSAGVTVLIIVSIIFGLTIVVLCICYKKVKCFRKASSVINKVSIGLLEKSIW